MTALSRTDLLASLDISFQEDLQAFKLNLCKQENLNDATLQSLIPESRLLFLRKILSRMLIVCLNDSSAQQIQELKILTAVVKELIASAEPSLSAAEAQIKDFEQTTAEFSKTIAQKERYIADHIAKSQQHIAGLQKTMHAASPGV
jgi:hypothetical protein